MKTEVQNFINTIPAVADAAELKETFWLNHKKLPEAQQTIKEVSPAQIEDASRRLLRFAPYLKKVFPELQETDGIIESELKEIPAMKELLNRDYQAQISEKLYLKMDSNLPVSGSVKARGGIYEVLKHAEDLAMEAGMLKETDDYSILTEAEFVDFFGKHTVQAGSNSQNLFMGYAAAGERLKKQLEDKGIAAYEEHPLFLYIPCGIGGAPGGVTYGIKQLYGDHVHCFFPEPTHACCMMLGMAAGLHDGISVKDLGIDGKTDADGLAVGRPSAFVGRVVEPMLSGIATIEDNRLYDLMRGLLSSEDTFIEPSSCAAFAALIRPEDMKAYIEKEGLADKMANSVHIAWAAGGRMVPQETREEYLKMGR